MRVIEVLQRTLLTVFVGVPVLVVLLDWLLQSLDAQEDNPIVETIRDGAELVTPEVLTTVFEDQAHWQTVLLMLVAFGILAVLIVVVFAWIERAVLAVRGRRQD